MSKLFDFFFLLQPDHFKTRWQQAFDFILLLLLLFSINVTTFQWVSLSCYRIYWWFNRSLISVLWIYIVSNQVHRCTLGFKAWLICIKGSENIHNKAGLLTQGRWALGPWDQAMLFQSWPSVAESVSTERSGFCSWLTAVGTWCDLLLL